MSSSNESTPPTEDAAKKDDTLPMPELAVINPNFSFDPRKLAIAAAERKLGSLRADLHKDLVQLITEGKTVDEAVRIIKRKIANEPKGPGED